jgi:hypothetical protein
MVVPPWSPVHLGAVRRLLAIDAVGRRVREPVSAGVRTATFLGAAPDGGRGTAEDGAPRRTGHRGGRGTVSAS